MAATSADVAVVEVGASPLEPYNGSLAINLLRPNLRFSVMSASDPYAVYGLMKAYRMTPDLVTGVTSNTLAGIGLVEQLCGVRAINFLNPENGSILRQLIGQATGMNLENRKKAG
jgi:hypothetical protein